MKHHTILPEKMAQLDLDDVAFNGSARLDSDVLSIELLGETFIISAERDSPLAEKNGVRI